MGSRLRDSDPQDVQFLESDNPGSTDSEVRKILTLHIPITEYDTLGSESDNECSAKSLKQSKYKTQRGELIRRAKYTETLSVEVIIFNNNFDDNIERLCTMTSGLTQTKTL